MLTLSIIARLPLAMFSIGLLVHAQRLTGSYAAAGLVTAAYAVALGIGGPLLGRVVDRRGQTLVLTTTAATSLVLLVVIAVLPEGVALGALIALSAGIGLATPPVSACVRTLLSDPRAFAIEASAVELCWVFGPPLALGAGALISTGAALVGAGAVLLGGTLAFAAHPASRAWRPAVRGGAAHGKVARGEAAHGEAAHGEVAHGEVAHAGAARGEVARGEVARGEAAHREAAHRIAGPSRGALRSGELRVLVAVMVAVGAIFGATEIGVTTAAETLGNAAAAGPLLGVWGVGSLLGGVWLARRGGVAPLVPLLLALAAGHTALAGAALNVFALAVGLLLAGAAIAPTYAVVYGLVERATPAGAITEAFAWLATAVSVGAALGSAIAGSVADAFGPSAVFVIAGAAGALALATASTRTARTPAMGCA
jgi:MFS family permease